MSTPALSPSSQFRSALAAERPLQIAGALNTYAALLAQSAGFRALSLSLRRHHPIRRPRLFRPPNLPPRTQHRLVQILDRRRPLGSYVMEQILFKISFPAEFHAQTAVECAVKLHPQIRDRLADIARIELTTHESAIRIIDKTGPLHNPADRDHCLQYMTAIGLIFGNLTAEHYEDATAADPRIDTLRAKMVVTEDKSYTRDYLDPEKRSIANAVQVFFTDGSSTEKIAIAYPIGHRRRRNDGIPLIQKKAELALSLHFTVRRGRQLTNLFKDGWQLEDMLVPDFVRQFVE